MNPIRVLLADDHMVVREGLRALLEAEGGFAIVGEADSGRETVKMVENLRPAVVVMDVAMPLLNGVEAMRRIRVLAPETRVLILSAHGDDEYVARAISAGAMGYLLKQSSAQLLAHAIREIERGRTFFSPVIARRLAAFRRRGLLAPQRNSHLTAREQEVLQLVAEGSANKQIAGMLGISIKTVEKHRQQLMDKLDIHDTAGLTRHAIAVGVIESSTQKTTAEHARRRRRSSPSPRRRE